MIELSQNMLRSLFNRRSWVKRKPLTLTNQKTWKRFSTTSTNDVTLGVGIWKMGRVEISCEITYSSFKCHVYVYIFLDLIILA